MQLAIYEILDQFKAATTREAKIHVLRSNNSQMLRDVLYLTFSPHIQFYRIDVPAGYKPDKAAPAGMGFTNLSKEMRRMYIWMKDHPASKNLPTAKRDELLIELLESLEAREAEMVIAMFRKNLPATQLTADLVKEAFPGLLA